MHSGTAPAMPLVRKAATFSFCQASRSVRITTAILVSNCMDGSEEMMSFRDGPKDQTSDAQLRIGESRDSPMCNCTSEVRAYAHRGMMINTTKLCRRSAPGVAGPGADHAFLAAEFVAFARRGVECRRYLRLDRVAMGAAGVGHIDRQRRARALHGHCRALALALLQRRSARTGFAAIVKGLAIGAAFADRECAGSPGFRDEARSGQRQSQRENHHRAALQFSTRRQKPLPRGHPAQNLAQGRFHLVNGRLKKAEARCFVWWGEAFFPPCPP